MTYTYLWQQPDTVALQAAVAVPGALWIGVGAVPGAVWFGMVGKGVVHVEGGGHQKD